MSEPNVCCVLLTADRPEMTKRAIARFWAQTYEPKSLLVLNSGERLPFPEFPIHMMMTSKGKTIGELRNLANGAIDADIIAHWDSDDWSAPDRLAVQVRQLQESRADAVGLREGLFWDSRKISLNLPPLVQPVMRELNEAWLYRHGSDAYCLGASLCYWRRAWEGHPFPQTSRGEDRAWLHGVRSVGYPAWLNAHAPLMIFEVHGGNTCTQIRPEASEWRRVPEWDAECRRIMEAR